MKTSSREARAILKLLDERAPDSSICPSEVARAISPEGWRTRMDAVREAAASLAAQGEVVITQKGKPVTLPVRGPIRIRRATTKAKTTKTTKTKTRTTTGAVHTTPDARYLVIDGRLWRAANPALEGRDRERFVHELMDARRQVAAGLRADDESAVRAARRRVHAAKVALGERGPVWWTDGAPDENRVAVEKSSYAAWHARSRSGPHTEDDGSSPPFPSPRMTIETTMTVNVTLDVASGGRHAEDDGSSCR